MDALTRSYTGAAAMSTVILFVAMLALGVQPPKSSPLGVGVISNIEIEVAPASRPFAEAEAGHWLATVNLSALTELNGLYQRRTIARTPIGAVLEVALPDRAVLLEVKSITQLVKGVTTLSGSIVKRPYLEFSLSFRTGWPCGNDPGRAIYMDDPAARRRHAPYS